MISDNLRTMISVRMQQDDYVSYEPVSRKEAEEAMTMSEELIGAVRNYLNAQHFLDLDGISE